MNDPVTNVEIEDVLSSIRRLVSENARSDTAKQAAKEDAPDQTLEALAAVTATHDAQVRETSAVADMDGVEAAPMVEDVETDSNMLVLTADHRVSESVDPHDEVQGDLESALEEIHHWGDDGAETRVEEIAEQSQLEEMVQEAIDEAVQDMVADTEVEPEIEVAQDDTAEMPGGADLGTDNLEEVSEALTFAHSEPEDSPEDEATALASRIAELEAAVAEVDDQWEPDGDGDGGENAGAPVDAMTWEDAEVPEAAHEHVWEADPLVVEEAQMVEPEPEPEPEPVEEFEPEPVVEAEPEPEIAADPQLTQNLDPTPELFAESDAVIDEDTLREMVAEIVRRELQGSLGERITRNVRKLVRREIHRALAARELD